MFSIGTNFNFIHNIRQKIKCRKSLMYNTSASEKLKFKPVGSLNYDLLLTLHLAVRQLGNLTI